MPNIAVIIVTFNRKQHLEKTLHSIINEGIPQRDIIVVNNNSSDGTVELLQSSFEDVQLVDLKENIASAGGFAKGMEVAHKQGYDWAALFNDDSRPMPGCFRDVMSQVEMNPGIDLIKVANRNENGKAVLLYWNGVRTPKYVDVSNTAVPTDLITFDACFISRRTFDTIGYCDPQYFMGTYEFDYCLKAKAAGLGIYTLPSGAVEDDKLGSASGTPPWRQYYNTRNHLWLALHLRSWQTLKGWFVRELKYSIAIIAKGDRKGERMLYKMRAVRDAILNRRGKVYLGNGQKKKQVA